MNTLLKKARLTVIALAALLVVVSTLSVLFLPARVAAAVAMVAVLAVLLLLLFYALRLYDPSTEPEFAASIATYFWRQLASLPETDGASVVVVRPLYDLDGEPSQIYDVKLKAADGTPKGYAIISVSGEDFPILEFATDGPSLIERLEELAPEHEVRAVWLTPTYTVGLSTEGEIIARLGSYTPDDADAERLSFGDMDRAAFHTFVWEKREEFRRKHRRAIRDAWDELLGGGKKTSDLAKVNPPPGLYPYVVEGRGRTARLNRIPADTGANREKDFSSGCGPVAWANFLAWHDLLWTPELLRGSQDRNGSAWGPSSHPHSEPAWECYCDRLIMDLNDRLDTYDNDGVGWTRDSKMKRGFGYIENVLDHDVTGKHEDSGLSTGNLVQKVYDRIVLHDRPVLVKTPSHFSVAGGFLVHPTSNKAKKQWLYINTGWGSWKYIRADHLEGLWYVRHILPKSKITYPVSSPTGPTLLTTLTKATGLYDSLWAFWLGQDDDIHYAKGDPGQLPNLTSGGSQGLGVQAIFEPAVTADESRIYLAYVSPDHRVHLKLWDPKYNEWEDLPFPDSIRSRVRPAICGRIGDWLTVAYCQSGYGVQLIGTNKQPESVDFWPSDIEGLSGDDSFWTQVDWHMTSLGLSLIRQSDRTHLIEQSTGYNPESSVTIRIGSLDGRSRSFYYPEGWRADGAVSQVVSNNTTFCAFSRSGRIAIGHYIHYRRLRNRMAGDSEGEYTGITYDDSAYLTETCIGDPSLAYLELENGAHPVLVVGWTGTDADHRLNLWLLSIDTESNPVDYSGVL